MDYDMMINIPIFITAKGGTKNSFSRSYELLPYAYVYIVRQQALRWTIIISDSSELLEYAKKLGFRHVYQERCINCQFCQLEFNGPYHYFVDNKTNCEWFIDLPLNQPFKSSDLILTCIDSINDNYDFITSYTEVDDRSDFYIDENNKFVYDKDIRRDSNCPKVRMLDGSIYCIKKSFLDNCVKSGNTTKAFWSGRFATVKNNAMYLPVRSKEHMKQLDTARVIFDTVSNLKTGKQ